MTKYIHYILIVVVPAMIISLLLNIDIEQVSATHSSFDLVNLREVSPTSTLAYDKIQIQSAWEFIKKTNLLLERVIIGVVDGGIDIFHPEFFPNVDLSRTISTIFKDDHGSAVAGIIGADNLSAISNYVFPQMNGLVSGILPKDKYVIGVRDFGDASTRSFEIALDDLIAGGAQIINFSLGAAREDALVGFTPEEKLCANAVPEAIFLDYSQFFGDYFKEQSSTIFVISAGNENVNIKDAAIIAQAISTPNVIIVSGTELDDTRLSPPFGSNYGLGVALTAPAVNVYAPAISTLPLDLGDYWHPQNKRGITSIPGCPLSISLERFFEGTSASAPLVTGVAAILKSLEPEYQKFTPELVMSPTKIKEILIKAADPIITDQPLGQDCFNFNPSIHTGCRENSHRAAAWLFPPKSVELFLTTTTIISSPTMISASSHFTPQFNISSLFDVSGNIKDFSRPSGTIEGTGTHFEIKDSKYLNIALDSSETIKLNLESVPEMIVMIIEPVLSTSTKITIKGLAPSTTYYKFQDDYHNFSSFITNETGVYTYIQDLSKPRLVFIQTRQSTKFIKDDTTGGDCVFIGIWDTNTKTCTLTADLFGESIQIDNDYITFDGNSHALFGRGDFYGIYLYRSKNVIIKNLTIKNFSYGILLYLSDNNYLIKNDASYNSRGIFLIFSNNNSISNNITNFNSGNGGINLAASNNNNLANNIANYNNGYGINPYYFSDYNIFSNNITNSNGYFGIYLYGYDVNHNTLIDNVADSNGWTGIFIAGSSLNILNNNTLLNNRSGLTLVSGSNNVIYNNNFINNLNQITTWAGSGNIFNLPFPVGGNYWSNFDSPVENCNDLNDDNFCDSPFFFTTGQDNLPWKIRNGWKPPKISVHLSWSKNNDPDFISYKIFRSLELNVDQNNTLIATIIDQNQTNFTDANLDSSQSFHYRVFIFDGVGLSSGSNEVSVK